jgi:hypothetical protein
MCLEETLAMWNHTHRHTYGGGLELLRQEYMGALSELKTVPGYTDIERLRLRKVLTDEYKLQRSEERKAIASQVRDDHEVGHKRM